MKPSDNTDLVKEGGGPLGGPTDESLGVVGSSPLLQAMLQ